MMDGKVENFGENLPFVAAVKNFSTVTGDKVFLTTDSRLSVILASGKSTTMIRF
jgi:hypothetical protein